MADPVTLASDLIDQARIAIEAARIHIETAGTPKAGQQASNLAAAYRSYSHCGTELMHLRTVLEGVIPVGSWQFDDGRVGRLPYGLPYFTTGRVQHWHRVGEYEGVRPRRIEELRRQEGIE